MTIVIALKNKKENYILMGCDTQGTSSYTKKNIGSKIFPLKVPVINSDNDKEFITLWIGVSGSHLLISYLKHSFNPPSIDTRWNFISYLYNQFFQQLQEELSLHKLLKDDNGVLDSDSDLIIVYNNEIYNIYDDFSILKETEQYSCVGSGWVMGNAILHNLLKHHNNMSYEDMLHETLSTIGDTNIYCNDKFVIKKIE